MDKLVLKYRSLSEPVKASLWYTICNVINKGIALLSTPIFTRVLTQEQYGIFAIFQSWYSIILIFTSLNIFLGGYQKGLLLYKEDRDAFTSSQLGLVSIITVFFGIIYIINPVFWSTLFELPSILMVAMFAELLFMPALEFWAAKERFDFKYKKYVIVSILMTVFSLGGGVIAVINTSHKVEARVYSDVIAKVIFAGVIFVLLFIKGKKFYCKKYWRYALVFNIPLLPHYLSNYILNQSDRIMIGKMIGNDKAAYYSVAYTISTMMMLVVSAVNNSFTPYIYKKIDDYENKIIKKNELERDIKNVVTPVLWLVAGLNIITMLFAPEIIYIFAGKNYAEAVFIVPPVALSVFFVFVYSMFSNIEYYYQSVKFIAMATFSSALLNFGLNLIFIKWFGYYAAGYTTLASYIFLALMHFKFYNNLIKKNNIDYLFDIKQIIILSIGLICLMFFIAMTYKVYITRYLLAVVITIILIREKDNISKIFKNIN